MSKFTEDQLRKRAFYRVAWVLHSFWEEQNDYVPKGGKADVHSRLFDVLIHEPLIMIGKSTEGGGHKEHLVPCALIRNRAFDMYHEKKSIDEVAEMIGRYLRIAHITPGQARHLDHELRLKDIMPPGWDFESGSVMHRLELGNIKISND